MKISSVFFLIAVLSVSCKKNEVINPGPTNASVTGLVCQSSAINSSATAGMPFDTVVTVPYQGGNGLSYAAGGAIASNTVSGLTATLQAGTLASGAGNLSYRITGTPTSAGVAAFSINFSERACTIALSVKELQGNVQYGTPFANVPDRQDAVIYQVNMRAFSTQSNFQGVIARLDSIKALGVNVIYLMPIYPVGTVKSVNSPYSVRDYKSVNPEFGGLPDLRTLVDGAHSRNMAIILDWVANHTAWDHPWISAHKDWYLQDGSGSIVSPPGTGWNDVAQLNFSNSDMRKEMINSMKYWIYTANVDGFRCDYADGPPTDFWKQAIDTLRNITSHKLLMMAEGSQMRHYGEGFDYIFGFNFYGQLRNVFNGQSANNIDAVNNSEYNGATNGQQVVRYITNHDVNGSDGTPQELFGGLRGSVAAFVVAAYMKGVPMVYNGQEVGTPYRLTFPFTGQDVDWSQNPALVTEYKKIISIRNNSTAIRRGQLTSYSNADVCAFTKVAGSENVFVAANVRNSQKTYTVPAVLANTNWTNAMTGTAVTLGGSITLQPYEYLILKR